MNDPYAGLSILIIEDESDARESIRLSAQKLSQLLTVATTPDPQNALWRCKQKHFDVIISSEKLQKMSGSYLKQKIVEIKEQEPPRFFLILCKDEAEQQAAKNTAGIEIMPKPIDLKLMEQWLSDALQKCRTATTSSRQEKKENVDVNFINPFIAATLKVLKVTCGVDSRKDKIFLKNDAESSGDISALVGLVSPKVRGSIGIAFERRCFLAAVSQMLGQTYKEITNDNQDAAGEICNQVFGMAKSQLNDMGYSLEPAIPSIIVGPGHRIKHMTSGTIVGVRFETPDGYFTVEAAIVKV